jgi:hypothetical protein
VQRKRRDLGLLTGPRSRRWQPEELALVGSASDREVAARLGRPLGSVRYKRQNLGIPAAGRARRGG